MRSTMLLLALLTAAPLATVHAAPADVANAVAAKDRPAEAVAMDASRRPTEVLGFLELERGDRALDLLTGTGYYAEIMGQAVGPEGSVIAAQPSLYFPDEMKKAWETLPGRVPNVTLSLYEGPKLDLEPDSLDFVMIHLNYHDFYGFGPAAPTVPAELYEAVKPGGVVGVVDHVGAAGADPKEAGSKLHRIDPALVRSDFEKAGFRFDGESEALRNPADDHSLTVFDPKVQGQTDRFVYRFRKPE